MKKNTYPVGVTLAVTRKDYQAYMLELLKTRRALSLLVILFFSFILSAQSMVIEFSPNERTVLGISLIAEDEEWMQKCAKDQAAVLYTRLQNSYSLYHSLNLDYHSEKYSTNFIYDADELFENLEKLEQIHTYDFLGYRLCFYNIGQAPEPNIKVFGQAEIVNRPAILTDDGIATSFGTAQSTHLDDALDMAFERAFVELSKYKSLWSGTVLQNESYTSVTRDVLSIAHNILSDVFISKIYMYLKEDSRLRYYIVQVELTLETE